MLVEDVMTREVITASPEATVLEALSIARSNRIRHVPIVAGNTLKGVVSDRDLRSVSPSVLASTDTSLLEGTLVKDIMVTDVITVHPLDSVEAAARLLYEHKIGCLPVVTGDNVLSGIVTDGDVLFCFVEMMGIVRRGTALKVKIPNTPKALMQVLDIVFNHRVNIISFYLLPEDKDFTEERQLLMRLQSIDPSKVVQELRSQGYEVKLPGFWEDLNE